MHMVSLLSVISLWRNLLKILIDVNGENYDKGNVLHLILSNPLNIFQEINN